MIDKPSAEPKPTNESTLAPPPELTALEPDHATTGSGQFMLELAGSGFTMMSQVYFDDAGQATTMLGQDRLSTPLDPARLDLGTINVSVVTGDHRTTPLPFTLTEPENPDGEIQQQP